MGEDPNTSEPIRVLLADDQTLFRQGLAAILASYEGVEVVAEVPNDEEALRAGPLVDFSPVVGMVGVAGSIVAAGSMVASAVSLIVRLRRAGRVERQQIKWLAYGGAVMVGGVGAGTLAIVWNVPLSITIMSVFVLGLPLFTGIAIVRHHLYDIDLLINRTLVYVTLTATLTLVYLVTRVTPRRPAEESLRRHPLAHVEGAGPKDNHGVEGYFGTSALRRSLGSSRFLSPCETMVAVERAK